jgi:hypothetical protein
VLLPLKVAQGVRDGSVTLAFRRWRKPDVEPGRRFTTAAGMVRVTAVEVVDPDAITDEEAQRAGWPDAARLRKRLNPDESLPTYRVGLVWDGEDPRIALREDTELTDDDVGAIDARLERLDRASPTGPWTMTTLALIGEHPQRRAPDLAEILGRETAAFKLDVRKLKALGLTRSFAVGYEISPRGRAYLDRTSRRP